MLRNRPAALFGATVLAGALAATGCAASAATTGAATTSAATTSAAAPAAARDNAHLMVYSINSDGPDLRAIVTGAIGDYGPAVTVFPNGQVNPSHTHDLELKLTRGSFKLSITELLTAWAASYRSRVMIAGWDGSGDQTHWSGGLRRRPRLPSL